MTISVVPGYWPASGAGKIAERHRHIVDDIHFAPRKPRGGVSWLHCTCGARLRATESAALTGHELLRLAWAEHRAEAGLPPNSRTPFGVDGGDRTFHIRRDEP